MKTTTKRICMAATLAGILAAQALGAEQGGELPDAKASELEQKLNILIDLEFQDTHVMEVLGFVSESFGIPFEVDERVLPAPDAASEKAPPPGAMDGIVSGIVLQDLPLAHALNAMLRPFNVQLYLRERDILITSPEMYARDQELETGPGSSARPVPEHPARDEELLAQTEAVIEKRIDLEFEQIHVMEALAFISDAHRVNVALDGRAIGWPRHGQMLRHERWVTDGHVEAINIGNMPLKTALAMLLRPLRLGYYIEPGYIYVTAPELYKGDAGEQPRPQD